jgi:hypothetical protein
MYMHGYLSAIAREPGTGCIPSRNPSPRRSRPRTPRPACCLRPPPRRHRRARPDRCRMPCPCPRPSPPRITAPSAKLSSGHQAPSTKHQAPRSQQRHGQHTCRQQHRPVTARISPAAQVSREPRAARPTNYPGSSSPPVFICPHKQHDHGRLHSRHRKLLQPTHIRPAQTVIGGCRTSGQRYGTMRYA